MRINRNFFFTLLIITFLITGCEGEAGSLENIQEAAPTASDTPPPAATQTPQPIPTTTPTPEPPANALTAEVAENIVQIRAYDIGVRSFGVDISPDQTLLAVGSLDEKVRVLDIETGEVLTILDRHRSRVYKVRFTPDGSKLLTASRDGTVQVWDTATWERLYAVRTPREASTLALTTDGVYFGAGGYYSARGMVWQSADGGMITALEGHHARFRSVVFSADGSMLASGDSDGVVLLRDTFWYEPLAEFQCEWGEVKSLAFSPEGDTLAIGMSQTYVLLYDLETLELKAELFAHGGETNALRYTPDGSMLITAGVDSDIGFWDATTGENIRYIATYGGSLNDLALTADGTLMATAGDDGLIRLFAIGTAD